MGRPGGNGRKPRIRVAVGAAAVLIIAAVIAWVSIPSDTADKVTVWFWLTLSIGAFELFVIAFFDFLGDWLPLPDLVTDLAEPWPAWRHLVLVPAFFLLGMVIDGLVAH
jgi:hypothetical protein